MKKVKDAIEVFKLNVEVHPRAANPYDSLGEAYMLNGDKELAVKNYRRSLELNPQNANAVSMLKRIESPPVGVNAKTYDSYVGQYELTPNFIASVTKEDDKLMLQATGQPKAELFPESETQFFLKVVDAQITFMKDEKGVVTGLMLHQNGQKIQGKKIK